MVIGEARKRARRPRAPKGRSARAYRTTDPTESYAQNGTALLKACHEMSRFAHASADDPRGTSYEILHSKRDATKSRAPSALFPMQWTGYGDPDARRPNPKQPRPFRPRRVGFGQPHHWVLCAAIRMRRLLTY
jgi:hypothetical protein